ncbi:MAG: DUF2510 domain-containing protein [Janthinobacterium lividum]
MSATSGWYPDPGGGQGLYRYWDGRAWSAATTTNPASAPPPQGIVNPGSAAGTAGSTAHANYGQGSYGQSAYGQTAYGQSSTGQTAYGQGSTGQGSTGQESYGQGSYGQGGSALGGGAAGASASAGRAPYGQSTPGQPSYASFQKRRSGVGWWVGAGVVLLVLVVVAVLAISRATSGGTAGGGASGQASSDQCPPQGSDSPSAVPSGPNDGRVHGGPVSYPLLPAPWEAPTGENRVPFGVNVLSQNVTVEQNYDGRLSNWVASITVGELQAGDGFFTPEQGSQIVVRCILGAFYGKNQVNSDVIVNKATTIDGHDAWLVESKLTFDITGLQTKGERLIVAIVQAGPDRSGLYYASIPDTTPQLLQPARDALSQLKVDG